MRHKKFLLCRQKRIGFADNGPQGRRHLHDDQDEDDDPRVESGIGAGFRMGKARFQKSKSEEGRDKPKHQVQRAHPGDGVGGLGKKPGYRRKADQQNGHQHQQPGYETANFCQTRLRPAQARENVKARQAD